MFVPAEILQPINYAGSMGVAVGVNIKQQIKSQISKNNVAAGINGNNAENPPI